MSTVMRPRGPLPPRVYWTRRGLVLVVVLLALLLLWWLLPAFGGSGDSAGGPVKSDPTPSSATDSTGSPDPTKGPNTTPNTSQHTDQGAPTQGGPKQGHSSTAGKGGDKAASTTVSKQPLVPTGACDPAGIALTVIAPDAVEGKGNTISLQMSTKDGTACTLGISSKSVEIRVVSEPVTIWDSMSCPDALAAKNVVVTPRPKVVYSIDWDGRWHPDSCAGGGKVGLPGGYWGEAGLIGGLPDKTFFAVKPTTTPRT